MLLLANENIPLASVKALRNAGHDVLSITEQQPGVTGQPRSYCGFRAKQGGLWGYPDGLRHY